jgi:hypothetical protein
VLKANAPLPLIPTSKRALAPSKIEDAEEGPGVCAYFVALECSFIFKGGVIAGLAGCQLVYRVPSALQGSLACLGFHSRLPFF